MNGTELLHYMIEQHWPGACVKLKLTQRGDYVQTSQGILAAVEVHPQLDLIIASNKNKLVLYLLELEGLTSKRDDELDVSDDPDLVVVDCKDPQRLAAEVSSISVRFGRCTLSVYDHILSYCSFLSAIHRATALPKNNSEHQTSPRALRKWMDTIVPCYGSQPILVGHTMSHFQDQVRNALRTNTVQLTDIQLVELIGPHGTIITTLTDVLPLLDVCVDSRTIRLQDTLLPKVSGIQIVFEPDSKHAQATSTNSYEAHWCDSDRIYAEPTLCLTDSKDQNKWQRKITRLPELRVLFPSFYEQVIMYTDYACGPSVPPFIEQEVVEPVRVELLSIGTEPGPWQRVSTRSRETYNQATQHGLFCNTEPVSGLFYVVSNTFIAVKVQCLYPHQEYIPTRCQIPTSIHRNILQDIPSLSAHTAANGWDWVVLSFTTLPFLLGEWQEMEHWAIRFCWHIMHT
jgi:hypothetical protein